MNSPSKGIKEGIGGLEDVTPIGIRVLLTRHFDNSFSVYLLLEFKPAR